MSSLALPNVQNCPTLIGTVGKTNGAEPSAAAFSSGSGGLRVSTHASALPPRGTTSLSRPLEQHDVAGPLDRSGKELVAGAGAPLVKRQVECDCARSARAEPLEQLRVQTARPGVELGRLTDGARRVARDADDDDLRRRRQRPADGKQQFETERLLEPRRDGQQARKHAAAPSTAPSTSRRRRSTTVGRPLFAMELVALLTHHRSSLIVSLA